jgi:apolipoprotein N-acyltransferase
VLLLGLPLAFGSMRLVDVAAAREQAAVLRVGVVQPDVSIRALREGMTTSARLARLETLSRDAAEQGAQVVLWPEAAYPVLISRAALVERDAGTLRFDGPDLPHIVGAMSTDLADASGCRRWNTLIATDASGRPSGHVDKRQRFPFAEYIPFWSWSSWLQARYACPGEQVGEGDALLSIAGAPLGLLNCYEDVGPGPARAATQAGAELLLNFSNDAWFGRTVQPELHRIVARFRAIETRRDLVRAVNTGEKRSHQRHGRGAGGVAAPRACGVRGQRAPTHGHELVGAPGQLGAAPRGVVAAAARPLASGAATVSTAKSRTTGLNLDPRRPYERRAARKRRRETDDCDHGQA